MKKTVRVFLVAIALFSSTVHPNLVLAAPSSEERVAFFAQKRKEKTDFERSLLSQTDSRLAAIQEFNANEQSDRVAFVKSIRELPVDERRAQMQAFNASARDKRKSFNEKLPVSDKNNLEKALEAFDKKAAADTRALSESLAGVEDPEARSEAVRLFQNKLQQDRAKIRSDAAKDLAKKKRDFNFQQTQKTRSFLDPQEDQ